jgi:uncharacterized membrane protein YhaH (DUF805 family)
MTDFLLGWIVVLLAMICYCLQDGKPKKEKSAGDSVRGMVSVFVTSFLIVLVFYGVVSLVWRHVLGSF